MQTIFDLNLALDMQAFNAYNALMMTSGVSGEISTPTFYHKIVNLNQK